MGLVKIEAPLSPEAVQKLRAGDRVLLSGIIYAARDAAHQRLLRLMKEDQPLPFDLAGQVIYYVGPTPAPPGKVIGAAGPTTSTRMDQMTPPLLARGMKGMIGKGNRGPQVIEAIKAHQGVYFAAIGGAGALISHAIRRVEVIAFEDLGTEAIRKLWVEDLPLITAIDSLGNNLYETGPTAYRRF